MELEVIYKMLSTASLEDLKRKMEGRLESIKENPSEESNYQTQRFDWQKEYRAICKELEERLEDNKI